MSLKCMLLHKLLSKLTIDLKLYTEMLVHLVGENKKNMQGKINVSFCVWSFYIQEKNQIMSDEASDSRKV